MSSWPLLYGFASLLFAAAVFASYFQEAAAPVLKAVLVAAALIFPAAIAGLKGLRWLGISADADPVERGAWGLALGLGALSLSVLGLCSLHRLDTLAAGGVLAAFALLGASEAPDLLAGFRQGVDFLRARPWRAAAILLPVFLAAAFAFAPPHQYDSLVYHLVLPEIYVRARGLAPAGWLLYSHFPQNAEMLFSLALLGRSDLAAQLLSVAAFAACLRLVLWTARRLAGNQAAFLAALLFSTQTGVMLLASTSYVEPLAMLWTTAAALSFLRWRAGEGRGWLALSGLMTGFALGTKYYAGITAGILGVWLAASLLGAGPGRRKEAAGALGLYAGLATLVFSPWLIKNVVEIGDPFFPFFARFFHSTQAGWSAQAAGGYFRALTEYGHSGRLLRDAAALPFLLVSNSQRFGRGMDVLGGPGWDLVLWLFPLGLWAARRDRFLSGLSMFLAAYVGAWFLTGVVFRFLTAAAPLFAIASGVGLARFWEEVLVPRPAVFRAPLALAAGLLVFCHIAVFLFIQDLFQTPGVLLGAEDGEAFLSRRLDYYPCAAFARDRLPANGKILVVGEQRSYGLRRDREAATLFAPNRCRQWANEAADPAQLAQALQKAGFSAILDVPREAARLDAALMPALSERGRRNWAGLERDMLKPVFRAPGCVLSVLGPGPS